LQLSGAPEGDDLKATSGVEALCYVIAIIIPIAVYTINQVRWQMGLEFPWKWVTVGWTIELIGFARGAHLHFHLLILRKNAIRARGRLGSTPVAYGLRIRRIHTM
jgi:hypothetical protein